ncbi:MAG: efflux RND transporter periplasmic adaptor subunit [Anaerolineae bacterium]|nr:efflux RND transporter periplasmic adaptor subunit [Anaerolineae bacterium]
MNSILKGNLLKNKKVWIALAAVIVIIAGVTGYLLLTKKPASTAKTGSNTLQTTQTRIGDLTLSASGTGTLTSEQEVLLNFSANGNVGKINVQPGNKVSKGDVLAELNDTTDLQAAVSTAELDLINKQQTLDDYQNSADSNLGEAQLALADAKEALKTAKESLKLPGVARCDADVTQQYYDKWMRTEDTLNNLGEAPEGSDYYISTILPAKQARDQAYATYIYCAKYTDYEISASQANLTIADANVSESQKKVDTLTENKGLDPYTLATYKNAVDAAQIALTKAKEKLAGAEIVAPMDGTIISVAGSVGDYIETDTTFITIADLDHPYVQFYIDESDLGQVAVGDTAKVVFDAFPDLTYTGKVTQLVPKLVTVSSTSAIQGLIQIDSLKTTSNVSLIEGLTASVDIIGGEAKNAVLLPVAALREIGTKEYGVFVQDRSGKITFKTVTVGLMDLTYAEIKEGLQAGETVTTGITETK